MDQHVGFRQQMLERVAIGGGMKVEPRAPLAKRDLGDDAGLVPSGRVDAQHVGTATGEETRCDRPGKDAREIENLQAVQWPAG
jgi:hypothetical protein